MARETTKWPSTRWPITKIMSSDGCNGNRVHLEMGPWYDFREFGCHLGNVGIMAKAAFIAYPGKPPQIGYCIQAAVENLNRQQNRIEYTTWEENDIAGRPLVAPIFTKIDKSCLIVADVTKLNFNVTYEIGYSIGHNRRVFLVRNSTVESDDDLARLVGIFDTLGYENYENSDQLTELLLDQLDLAPLGTVGSLDRKSPTYILETPQRSEAMLRMVGRIKKARLQYRSFAPSEDTRLAALEAIAHVSNSYGVLIPLLEPAATDSTIHNMRAAFIAGLSHGMNKITLILRAKNGSAPLDLRDFAKTYGHPDDVDEHIQAFALDVYEKMQRAEQIDCLSVTISRAYLSVIRWPKTNSRH